MSEVSAVTRDAPPKAWWSVDERVRPTLKGLELDAFGRRGVFAAEAFVSLVREFLGLQAGWRVELDLDTQARLWAAPLAVTVGWSGVIGWPTMGRFVGTVGWVVTVDSHSSPPRVGTQYRIRPIAIDMCAIYASAVRRMLPGAVIAVDLFHVVQLAVNAGRRVCDQARRGLQHRVRDAQPRWPHPEESLHSRFRGTGPNGKSPNKTALSGKWLFDCFALVLVEGGAPAGSRCPRRASMNDRR
jgi:hypothetical protein